MTLSITLPAIFRMEGREYEHFAFDTDFLSLVILALCAGLLLAVLFSFVKNRVTGIFVRRLLSAEAFSPESAKTLDELGYGNTLLIRAELGKESLLTDVVLNAAEEPEPAETVEAVETAEAAEPQAETVEAVETAEAAEPQAEEVADEEPRYYIPEAEKYRAEVRFAEKVPRLPGLILSIVLILVLAVLLIKFLPAMLAVVDGIM